MGGETPDGPGYCACCGDFHMLRAVEVPELDRKVPACGNCAARGAAELAWLLDGIGEDGPTPGAVPRQEGSRRERERLLRSLFDDESGGFGVPRRGARRSLLAAWLRLSGRL